MNSADNMEYLQDLLNKLVTKVAYNYRKPDPAKEQHYKAALAAMEELHKAITNLAVEQILLGDDEEDRDV